MRMLRQAQHDVSSAPSSFGDEVEEDEEDGEDDEDGEDETATPPGTQQPPPVEGVVGEE
ncbi:MAG: hypothetical protein AMXMBFR61_24500 [Fimbriimonadales bacterium]